MSLVIFRKVFIVVAGGNASAQRHFEDTIQRKRTLDEVRKFLPTKEIENLERIYHGSDFIVWGAVPGPMNENRWEKMAAGDVDDSSRRGSADGLSLRVSDWNSGTLSLWEKDLPKSDLSPECISATVAWIDDFIAGILG